MIRVLLPPHLQNLAGAGKEIEVTPEVGGDGTVTAGAIIDAIEAAYPMLRGTIRDYQTRKRRPMVRFFVSEQDLSHDPMDTPLPDEVARGDEPFWIVGAISGG